MTAADSPAAGLGEVRSVKVSTVCSLGIDKGRGPEDKGLDNSDWTIDWICNFCESEIIFEEFMMDRTCPAMALPDLWGWPASSHSRSNLFQTPAVPGRLLW